MGQNIITAATYAAGTDSYQQEKTC